MSKHSFYNTYDPQNKADIIAAAKRYGINEKDYHGFGGRWNDRDSDRYKGDYEDFKDDIRDAANRDYSTRRTLEAQALAGDADARERAKSGFGTIKSVIDTHEKFKADHKARGNNPDDFYSASDWAQMTMAAVDHDRKVFNQSIDSRIAAATAEQEEPAAEAPEEEEYKPSRRLAQAQALVGTSQEDTVNNYIDIYKPNASQASIDNLKSSYARNFNTDGVSVSADQKSKSQDFLDVYKENVKGSLKPA